MLPTRNLHLPFQGVLRTIYSFRRGEQATQAEGTVASPQHTLQRRSYPQAARHASAGGVARMLHPHLRRPPGAQAPAVTEAWAASAPPPPALTHRAAAHAHTPPTPPHAHAAPSRPHPRACVHCALRPAPSERAHTPPSFPPILPRLRTPRPPPPTPLRMRSPRPPSRPLPCACARRTLFPPHAPAHAHSPRMRGGAVFRCAAVPSPVCEGRAAGEGRPQPCRGRRDLAGRPARRGSG